MMMISVSDHKCAKRCPMVLDTFADRTNSSHRAIQLWIILTLVFILSSTHLFVRFTEITRAVPMTHKAKASNINISRKYRVNFEEVNSSDAIWKYSKFRKKAEWMLILPKTSFLINELISGTWSFSLTYLQLLLKAMVIAIIFYSYPQSMISALQGTMYFDSQWSNLRRENRHFSSSSSIKLFACFAHYRDHISESAQIFVANTNSLTYQIKWKSHNNNNKSITIMVKHEWITESI